MKTEVRFAALFASAAFLIVGVGGYFSTLNPLHSMISGLAASAILAFLGYKIAYTIRHPRRPKKGKRKRAATSVGTSSSGHESLVPLTGEETFLDDV